LQAGIGDLFREYLSTHGFIEIHSPKLQGAATESGASVFKVGYFKGIDSVNDWYSETLIGPSQATLS